MSFYIPIIGSLVNTLMFHVTGNPANLLSGFIFFFAAALNYLASEEIKEIEDKDDEF